jgi:branched-chain amino acid transport system ATP-binding protein
MFRLGVGDVRENLRLATRVTGAATRWPRERIFEYFPALQERRQQKGRSLSGGEQQMLAVARALVGEPELLLLDEPSQGLAPLLVRALGDLLRRLRGEGLTILLVEQNVRLALAVADRVAVLGKGKVVFTGTLDDFNAQAEDLRGRYLAP